MAQDDNAMGLPAMNPKEQSLLPCPFCDSPDVEFMYSLDAVHCHGCSAQGASADSLAEAAEKWNRRATGKLAYELDGVIADVRHGMGFDVTCLETVRRVRDALHGIRVNDAALQSERGQVIEECAKVCESFVVPHYQAGGDAIEAANYAFRCCAGAIRAIPQSESQQPRSDDVGGEDR